MITAIQKPKRKYGEGSIYQRKDGRWVAKFKGEGMTKPRVVYAKSEPEAKRKLRELKKDAAKGIAECKRCCSAIMRNAGCILSSSTLLRTAALTGTKAFT